MNNFRLIIVSSISSLLILPTIVACQPIDAYHKNLSEPKVLAVAKLSPEKLRQLAESFTVKILAADSRGSGIIIRRQGELYTALTNSHVLTLGDSFRVQTPDGKTHTAELIKKDDSLIGEDLALLQFRNSEKYNIAQLSSSSQLKKNQQVFAAGFADNQEKLSFSAGKISMLPVRALVGGYQIGFSNQTQQGMSGGPLLNQQGKVIGVNGLGDVVVLEDAYKFQDGSTPKPQQLKQMRQLAWSIPIEKLGEIAPQLANILSLETKTVKLTGVAAKVDRIAEQVGVRIDSQEHGNGSGVIVARQGKTYYVLTAAHVVKNQDKYRIVTAEGRSYPLADNKKTVFEGADLALVQFNSPRDYSVARLADYDLDFDEERWIFLSGFLSGDTGNINTPKRRLNAGVIQSRERAELLKKDLYSFAEGSGYQLIYTNLSQHGMSGGALLDSRGRVIGINTGSENEIDVSSDGQITELNLGRSLGIPIHTFLNLAPKAKIQANWLQIENSVPESLTDKEINLIKRSFFPREVPGRNARESDWLNYGNQLWRMQENDRAVKAFKGAIERKPDFHQAYYSKGLALNAEKKYQAALTAFDKAVKLQPQFYEAWREKSYALFELERYPEALTSIEEAIKIQPKDSILYLLKGDILYELKRYSESINTYTEALKIKPNFENVYAYGNRGSIYAELKQYEKALADFNKVIETHPKNAKYYFLRGEIHSKLKQHEKAIADVKKAIEISPKHVSDYLNRSHVYLELKEYEQAIADLNKAIDVNPEYVTSYLVRGHFHFLLKYYKKAIADFNKAIETNPRDAIAYNFRGLAYHELKDYDKAIADFNKAIAIDPKHESYYFIRGYVYLEQKQYEKAIVDFSKAIEINPKYVIAYDARGLAYLESKQYKKALDDSNKAIELNPENAEFYTVRGYVYRGLKEYNKALADFNKALTIDAKSIDPNIGIGLIEYELGNIEQAIAQWQKSIKIDSQEAQPQMAIAVALYAQGKQKQGLEIAKAVLKVEKKLADPKYLKEGIFWGEALLKDAQKLTNDPEIRS